MAKFAVVAPLNIVERLDEMGILGSTHLLLAHDVVAPNNRERYHRLFHPEGRSQSDRSRLKPDRHIIMDNSVIELGRAVDPKMLQDACQIVDASCVVLPDVLEDASMTLASCVEAVLTWDKYDLPPYMMVPQGKTLSAFLGCAEAFVNAPVDYWGVPRNLVKLHGTRRDAIRGLDALAPTKQIHLMGFSDNIEDDIMCAQFQEVHTIDSAVPLRAQTIMTIDPTDPYTHQSRGEWWQTAKFHPVIPQNLARVRKWVNGGQR